MKRFLWALSYVLVAVAASCATLFLMENRQQYPKLTELGLLIEEVFIDEIDHETVENAAAAAMVNALGDRWSHYMTAEEYRDYQQQMQNAYVGIGVNIIKREDGYIDIVKVEPGGPAQEAGIVQGDVLTAVDGQNIATMDTGEVRGLVLGQEGTKVELTLDRDGEILKVMVERRMIQSIVATGQMLDNQTGLVRIENFDSRCADETLAAVEALLDQGASSLIFDVRNNPGGYQRELVKILDYLLPEGPLFRCVDYNGRETVDMSDAKCLKVPMAVLINGDSYSAAEFFAAALSEYGVAVLIGEPTIGKDHVQKTFRLSDGSAVVISTGKYRTPNGVSLAESGVTPDVVVKVDEETYMNIYYGTVKPEEDPQVQAALKVLQDRE